MFNFSNMSMLELTMFWLLGCALVVPPVCRAATGNYQKHVHEQCRFTTYPSLCVDTMTVLGSANQQVDIVSALINKTIFETRLPTSYFTKFSSNLETEEAQHVNSVTGFYYTFFISNFLACHFFPFMS